MTQTLQELNANFAIDQVLQFSQRDELIVAEINTPLCSASLALQGAQLLQWQPHDHEPVLFLSEQAIFRKNKAIRGGIPVCWPWFSTPPPHLSTLPAHGFARMHDWCFQSARWQGEHLVLELDFSVPPEYQSWFGDQLGARLQLSIGSQLDISLYTHSPARNLILTEALHTYFYVADVAKVELLGLKDHNYLDKLDHFVEKIQVEPLLFEAEVDRIYRHGQACQIHDLVLDRRIIIEKMHSANTIVWNPWAQNSAAMSDMGPQAFRHMLCVESGNVADQGVDIPAGMQHCLQVCYKLA